MIRAGHDAGIPVIYQELGTPFHPPDFAAYYREFTSALPLCSEIAALSPLLVEHCREKLSVSILPTVMPIMTDELDLGRRTLTGSTDDVVIGFAARVEKPKGLAVLIEAFAAAHRESPNLRLVVAGDGSQRHLIDDQARALRVSGSYSYAGVYTNLYDRDSFMRNLDVFVLPSFAEGTPNSIIEAMAHGKPVIASAVGGIPDMIDAESGILVPPGDSAALADAILRLADDPELRKRMGKSARHRYEQLFSPKAVLPVLVEIYRRVANRGPHNGLSSATALRHPWMAEQCETVLLPQ